MQPVSCKYLCTFWLGRRLPFLILRIQLINTILLSLQWWLFDAIKVWLTWVFCLRDGVGGTEARHGTSSARPRLRGELSQTWQRIEGPGRARHAATTQSGAALLIIGGHYAHRAGSSSAAVERSVVQPIPQQADSAKTPPTTHHSTRHAHAAGAVQPRPGSSLSGGQCNVETAGAAIVWSLELSG